MIKFSVIVPLYNCEKYISECIDSILSQQYSEFEVVVVNDGSTDNSREIVANYSDERIKIIDKENGGLLHARLTGLTVASNDYVVFVDADDKIRPTLLQDLAVYLKQGNDVVIYKLVEFIETGFKKEPQGLFPHATRFQEKDRVQLLTRFLTTGDLNSIVCKAFKKDLIPTDVMEEYPRIAIGEDALFTMHLLERYSGLIYLDYPYYEYRQFSESMTHKLKISNYTDNVFRFDLYYKLAQEAFDGIESRKVISAIDCLFFRMVISSAVNSKMRIESKEAYRDFIGEIGESKMFQEKMRDSYKSQSLPFKMVLKSIAKKNIRRLLLFRQAFKIIFNT